MSNNPEKMSEPRLGLEREAATLRIMKEDLRAAKEKRAQALGVSVRELPLEELAKISAVIPSPEYETSVWPPKDQENDPNIPLHITWTNGSLEYDVFLASQKAPDEATLVELQADLYEIETDRENQWGVINRGEGRINILPPLQVPRHRHVAEVVLRVFAEGSDEWVIIPDRDS